jgi:hypothetical protein
VSSSFNAVAENWVRIFMIFIERQKKLRGTRVSDARSMRTHFSATAHAARTGPIYAIRLQADPGTDGIRALRAVLKVLWRRYQLRCLEAREVKDGV